MDVAEKPASASTSMPPRGWLGEYTDGKTAALRAVTVHIIPGGVRFDDVATGQPLGAWPAQALTCDDKFAKILQLRSASAPGEAVTIGDLRFRAALAAVLPQLGKPRLERGPLALGLLAAVLLLAGGIWAGLTPASEAIARRIPFRWETEMSGNMRSLLEKRFCKSPLSDQALKKMRDRLLAGIRYPVEFDIHVVDDPAVNAYALPGGLIVVNRGLLDGAESPDELAGVLAHEMQHVIQRHITAGIVRGALLTSTWQLAVGDFSGLLVVDPSSAYNMATLSFSRKTETEADRGAAVMLDRSGVPRDGIIKFFERLQKQAGSALPGLLSTHPPTGERIKLFSHKNKAVKTSAALALADWNVLKAGCGSDDDDDADDADDDDSTED